MEWLLLAVSFVAMLALGAIAGARRDSPWLIVGGYFCGLLTALAAGLNMGVL